MTTDLTGDFELGEDEFDWDVFLPDPNEAEIAAEAAALEDESELDLDDSDFDWEAALHEDRETENDADGARAGAAYDRIVNTVRESVEEPETDTEIRTDPEARSDVDVVTPAAGLPIATATDTGSPLDDLVDVVPAYEAETGETEAVVVAPAVAIAPHDTAHQPPEADPQWAAASVVAAEHDLESAMDSPAEPEPEWEAPLDPIFVAGPDLEPVSETETETEPEPLSTLAEPVAAAATAAAWTGASDPTATTEPSSTLADERSGESPEDVEDLDGEADWFTAEFEEREDEEPRAKKRRSRVFTATIVLAVLFLAAIAAVVAVRGLHHSTTSASPPAAVTRTAATAAPSTTKTTAPSTSVSQSTTRVQTATDAVDSAATAASVGLNSLAAFPTPTNVENIINPYIASLQIYETVLSGNRVPTAARAAAASVQTQVHQNLQFLDTINGLAPAQLGAYLAQFNTDATELQTTLSTLEQNLRPPTS